MYSIWTIIAFGVVVLTTGLAVVVRTRWLQSHTLGKCVLLSICVHLLLAVVCGFLAGIMPASWGHDEKGQMTMVMVLDVGVDDAGGGEESAPRSTQESTDGSLEHFEVNNDDADEIAQSVIPLEQSDHEKSLLDADGIDDVVPLLDIPDEHDVVKNSKLLVAHEVPSQFADRSDDRRAQAAAARGGSEKTEKAVRLALQWLAMHQSEDGHWDPLQFGGGRGRPHAGTGRNHATGIGSDHGVSGLALLAFLGAGTTHMKGQHMQHVARGIQFLINRQRPNGSLAGDAEFFARLYCHGMAGMALAECAAMTGDESLHEPLKRAVSYTLSTQHPVTGGWRYAAGDQGDTSQLGWQVMFLESAALVGFGSHVGTAIEKARERARRFLKSVSSGRSGGLASYRPGERPTMPMTAEALFCRLKLGLPPDNPSVHEAMSLLDASPPSRSRPNVYAWYYATLASFHAGGPQWYRWNQRIQSVILPMQHTEGSLRGSWDPDPVWGGHGGRVYATAMAALTLEVYYRHIPRHIEASLAGKTH
ncbi:MAG: prenyltransferase/squalene oxidase repeat-containing protein [Pirellulales bacterium]